MRLRAEIRGVLGLILYGAYRFAHFGAVQGAGTDYFKDASQVILGPGPGVATRLNAEGHRTVKGKHWQPTQVRNVLLRCAALSVTGG
ncbi:hypothetical protein GCM10022631_10200 [Deinococcus rubellus]|uniref:hypothetical protein n=1 Tax=Deinococcus rubellus TaxID=1889240 RepID=UPI0031EBD916